MRIILSLAFSAALYAQPARPPIVGVAHIGLKTNDLAASRNFYGRDLGFQEPFTLDKATGGLLLTYFKVNDHQYIEVFPELKDDSEDRLSHIAFETTDIRQLRDYLAAHGVKVPETVKPGLDGNISMMIKDPDGHNVELVQYMPGSLHTRNFGKFLPSTRISERIIHVGVTVQDRDAADRFYKDILGFREMWHGGRDRRPDGLGGHARARGDGLAGIHAECPQPSPKTMGVMHHLALGVPNVGGRRDRWPGAA